VATSYLLIRAIETPERRAWRAYGISLTALGLLNLFSLLIIPAHAVTLAAARRRGGQRGQDGTVSIADGAGQVREWAAGVAVACGVAVPIAVFTWHQRQQLAWLDRPQWDDLFALLTMMGGSAASFILIAALGVAGAILAGSRTSWPRRVVWGGRPSWLCHAGGVWGRRGSGAFGSGVSPERHCPRATRCPPGPCPRGGVWGGRPPGLAGPGAAITWLSAPWLILPPALLLVISEVKPFYVYRYVVFCLPALALLTAAGLSVLGRLPCIACIAVIALFALPMQHAVRAPSGHGDDIRAAAQFLRAETKPGDAVIYNKFGMRDWATAYPYGFTALRDVGLRQSAVTAGNLSGTQVPPRVLSSRLRSAARVWLVEVDHNRPDRSVIGPPRFRLTGVWLISDIVLRLYERAGGRAAPPQHHQVIPIRLEAWPPSLTGT
jgi:hypothetical protein